jgi:hypothetical protein
MADSSILHCKNNHDYAGKFPEANTRAPETPSDEQPTVKKLDKAPGPMDLKKGLHVVAEDSNKQPTVITKKQKKAPVNPKKGLGGPGMDSNKHQKLPKIPLPLPSEK